MSPLRPFAVVPLVVLLAFPRPAAACGGDSVRTPFARADTLRTPSDSVAVPRASSHSPGTAMLLSALLPGAGQFYNRSYWKVPVVVGLGLYFTSEWLDSNRRTNDYREQYAASLLKDGIGDNQLLRYREFYKNQRDTFTWYFVLLYLLNIVDAYVDAHLFDFDVGTDLAFRSPAGLRVPAPTLTFHIPIP
jgi:hypothetical protein